MGRKELTVYSREVDALVRSQIPKSIHYAMAELGWNEFGIYELVKEELRKERIRLRRAAPASTEREK